MTFEAFWQSLQESPRPVVVDVWASWCAPCVAMAPLLEEIAAEYEGRVEVRKVDSDDEPEVVRGLGVRGIPTLLAFNGGRQVTRATGMLTRGGLRELFDAAVSGEAASAVMPVARREHLLRVVIGGALAALGWLASGSVVLIGLGAIIAAIGGVGLIGSCMRGR